MFSINAKGFKNGVWWSNSSCFVPNTSTKEEASMHVALSCSVYVNRHESSSDPLPPFFSAAYLSFTNLIYNFEHTHEWSIVQKLLICEEENQKRSIYKNVDVDKKRQYTIFVAVPSF